MSVPVRYSAAANYAAVARAAVASGLDNTLTQEEQYHYQQQQQHQQQQQQHQQQQQNSAKLLRKASGLKVQQQQLMQQWSSMSSPSKSPSSSLASLASLPLSPLSAEPSSSNRVMKKKKQINIATIECDLVEETTEHFVDVAMPMTLVTDDDVDSMMVVNDIQHDDVDDVDCTEMRPDRMMMMSDEGRFGTPGAAGLEYQRHEREQQQQHQAINNNTTDDEPAQTDHENNNNSNNLINLDNELNAVSSDELFNTLKEYDALQDKYHTVLMLPRESRREVTAGGRDGAAYVLRCLKMWYELPSDVLFSAMSLVDRFLDRMAVKPKHMACMSVASFHLAIKQLGLKPIPAEDLVTISQCGCTAGDLERMAGVIANKLGVQMGHAPITSVSYLRLYYALFRNLSQEIGGPFAEFYGQLIKLEDLENRLEILLCNVKTTVMTPSTLALVLICLHLDFHIKESYTKGSPELKHVFEYILWLQQYMRIPDNIFTLGFTIVSDILSHYNGQNKQPYKQRLVWKLSSRTLRVLRPINRFSTDLPTIAEGISNAMEDDIDGCRSRTESMSSEEEEDWPTSAIIPIFEQC